MRRFAALTALALTVALPAQADPVVVELFTSQGCSSCPAADAMLGELSGRSDVIALSLHVDYWDWIGWADTFADPAFTARQKAYAAAAGTKMIFTPQFIVNGQRQIAGAKGMALADTIQSERSETQILSFDGTTLRLAQTDRAAHLVLVEVLPQTQVAIALGENAGRQITYHQVVRNWQDLGPWSGAPEARPIPPKTDPRFDRIVLAQTRSATGHPGEIIGAVRLD